MLLLRRVLLIFLVLILVLVVAAGGGSLYLRGSLPRTSGSVRLAGLDGPVDIVRDRDGIPCIYASTDHDAFFGVGYVHAYLKPIFHRSIATSGDPWTVDPAPFRLNQGTGFNSFHVPSYREIIDLSDFDNARFIHTTGQSGNVLGSHYSDFISRWRDVQYLKIYWTRAKVDGAPGTSKLTLQPAGK